MVSKQFKKDLGGLALFGGGLAVTSAFTATAQANTGVQLGGIQQGINTAAGFGGVLATGIVGKEIIRQLPKQKKSKNGIF